jgi:hypothetical protein
MPVDTSIYGQFAAPAKSTADYAAQYDAADARRMTLQQNALALQSGRQKLDEYQRGVNEQGMLRNALAQLPQGATDEQRIQAMRGTNLPIGYTQADALQKTLIERDKGQAEARAKQAEVLGKVLTAQGELATRVIANPTRESAMAAVANMRAITQALGVPLDLTQDEQQIAQMSDPAQITRWAQGHSLKATDFLAKLQQVNNGKTTSFVDVNSVSNPGGPAPITMTTTPGEDLTAATALAGQRSVAATAASGRDQTERHFTAGQDAARWDPVNQVWVNQKAQTVTPGTLPNGQPMPGKTPPIEYQKLATAFQNMDDALTNYKTVLAGFGKGDMLSPTKRAEMGQAYQNALLQSKEIYQLGVLNGGDERILKGIINSPLDFTSAMIPTEALKKQATDLQGILVRNNENLAKVHRQTPIPLKSTFGDKQTVPQKNAKGWEIHTDAKGNKAYVSPDGKQFEEVKSGV